MRGTDWEFFSRASPVRHPHLGPNMVLALLDGVIATNNRMRCALSAALPPRGEAHLYVKAADLNTPSVDLTIISAHEIHTVHHKREQKIMSSISTSVDLLRDLKSLILQFAQDHGIFLIGAILGLVVLYAVRYLASPYRKLPPGPRGYPIIGNLLELREAQWLKFTEWRKKYGQFIVPIFPWSVLSPTRPGDIFYLDAAGQPIIIINSRKVALNLLERRAGIYSDRPTNIVACELMCNGLFFVFARYGDM
jgi:hypothetical protein